MGLSIKNLHSLTENVDFPSQRAIPSKKLVPSWSFSKAATYAGYSAIGAAIMGCATYLLLHNYLSISNPVSNNQSGLQNATQTPNNLSTSTLENITTFSNSILNSTIPNSLAKDEKLPPPFSTSASLDQVKFRNASNPVISELVNNNSEAAVNILNHFYSQLNLQELNTLLVDAIYFCKTISANFFEKITNFQDIDQYRHPKDNSTLLFLAIAWGQNNLIEPLLNAGANPLASNSEGNYPLLAAINNKNTSPAVLSQLLKKLKHSVDECRHPQYNSTLLHLAVDWERNNLVGPLLEAGADPLALNSQGWYPLLAAINNKNTSPAVLSQLLKKLKRPVDECRHPQYNSTLLHLAVHWGRNDLVGSLLEAGSDPLATNTQGGHPLLEAINNKNTSPVALSQLLNKLKGPVDKCRHPQYNSTLLHLAVHWERNNLVGPLLEAGADPLALNSQGWYPLLAAINNKNTSPAVLSQLLKKLKRPVDECRHPQYNSTLLHLAVHWERNNLVGPLLNAGADPVTTNSQGWYPLLEAINNKNAPPAVLSQLLKKLKHSVDECRHPQYNSTQYNSTLLHLAVHWGRNDLVEPLLNAGANPLVAKEVLRSPLALALATDNFPKNVLRLMIEKSKLDLNAFYVDESQNRWLHYAVLNNKLANGATLIELGADPSTYNKNGETALTLLAQKNPNTLDKNSIEKIATRDALSKCRPDGLSPLMLACYKKNWELVKLFIKLGADKAKKLNDAWLGNTAYDIAKQMQAPQEIVELLKLPNLFFLI